MRLDLMTWGYREENGKPVIYLKGRDRARASHWIRVTGFKPHFYAVTHTSEHTDILNRPIKEIAVTMPRDVILERQKYQATCEAKLPYVLHFLIHKKVKCGMEVIDNNISPAQDLLVEPKVLYFDFEMLSPPEVLPSVREPKYPIVSMAFRDKDSQRDYIFMLEHPKATKAPGVTYFKREYDMYMSACKLIHKLDVDVLAGWFSNHYDLPYWYRRSKQMYFPIHSLSSLGTVIAKWNPELRKMTRFEVYGLECVDLLDFYIVLTKPEGKKFSYDLKYLVNEECSYVYEDLGDSIDIYFKGGGKSKSGLTGHEALAEYARSELKALELIDEHRQLIAEFDRRRRIFGSKLDSAHIAIRNVIAYLHRITAKPLPTFSLEKAKTFRGALVSEVKKRGLHRNVAKFDVKSMYPRIIIDKNLSFETKVKSGAEVQFLRRPQGLLSKAVESLVKEREKLRSLRLGLDPQTPEYELIYTREQSFKYAVRAFWGSTKHLDLDIAKTITKTGREVLMMLHEALKRIGYEVIYHDTDSVFVPLRSQSPVLEGQYIESYLNKCLYGISERLGFLKPLEIKFEALFKLLFLHSKKHYVGRIVYLDGKTCDLLDIKGIAARRSDSASITVRLQREFFNAILMKESAEEAIKVVQTAVNQFHRLPLSEIVIPKGITKTNRTNPWIRGMKNGTKYFKFRYREDKKPLLLHVRKCNLAPSVKELCFPDYETADSYSQDITPDYPLMIEKTIKKKFEPLIEALGYDWSYVVSGTKQTTLSRWAR